MRLFALTLFTIGMMFALHPLPREPWGILGLGDLFIGYVLSFVGGTAYTVLELRHRARPRATVTVLREYRQRRAA